MRQRAYQYEMLWFRLDGNSMADHKLSKSKTVGKTCCNGPPRFFGWDTMFVRYFNEGATTTDWLSHSSHGENTKEEMSDYIDFDTNKVDPFRVSIQH